MTMEDGKKSEESYSRFERMMLPDWVFHPGNEEHRRRTIVAYVTVFIAIVILIIFGCLRLLQQDILVGFVELSFAMTMAVIVLYHRATKRFDDYLTLFIGVAVYGIFCICTFFFNKPDRAAFLWSYTFPLMVFPLLGSRRGTVAITLFIIPISLLLIIAPPLSFITSYPRGYVFPYIASILAVSGMSYLYEKTRERNERRLKLANIALQRSKEEMEQQVQQRTSELARSEEKYRNILENIDEAYFELDLKGDITFFNDSACSISGYSKSELMGMNYRQYTSPEAAKMLRAVFSNIYQTGERESLYDFELIMKDKSTHNMELSVNFIRDSEGNGIGFRCIARDITERKKAVEALHQSEEKYRAIIENMEEGYMEVDLKGRIAFFNEAARNFLGYSREETMGMHYKNYTDEENARKILEAYGRMYETGVPLRFFEWEARRKDGTRRAVEGSASLIADAEGRPKGFRGLFRDITERKWTEDKLKKYSAELIEKNEEIREMSEQLWQAAKLATMGELSASIAHELNNPLATVSLRIESLLTKTQQDGPMWRELKIIAQEIERMAIMTANLLQFSRRRQKEISTVDICEEIEKAMELVYYHLRKHNIVIRREFVREYPSIHADRQELRQLLLNLFTNASDAMPQGGTLGIRVTAPPESMQVIIEVADTGTGIPPEIMSKVVEPFYTTKPEGKGTGLGLAICRRIVQEHNGIFDLTSEGIPGRGATARISLPINDGTNSASLKNQ